MSRRSIKYQKCAEGNPEKVMFMDESPIQSPNAKEVLVRVLASPINPVDLLMINGYYPTKPSTMPATAGTEGVGEVVTVGEQVAGLKEGDRVVITFPAPVDVGVWTSYAVFPEENLFKIPRSVPVADAAMMSLNPATALAMLKSFVKLEPGDTVIQNVANSAVGQLVHQMCRCWGVKSVGIIRSGPKTKEYRDLLKGLGANEVLTVEELGRTNLFYTKYKPPKLALSAYGGKVTELMSKFLDKKGVLVSYGVMTDEPITVDPVHLLFNQFSVRGFSIASWYQEHPSEKRKVHEEILEMFESGKIKAPVHEMIKPEDYLKAIQTISQGRVGKKFILDFQDPQAL